MTKKQWITKQILTKIREKNKNCDKYLKSKAIFWYNRYINSRNTVKRLIEINKRSYYRNYLQENSKQSINFMPIIWHKINEILKWDLRSKIHSCFYGITLMILWKKSLVQSFVVFWYVVSRSHNLQSFEYGS